MTEKLNMQFEGDSIVRGKIIQVYERYCLYLDHQTLYRFGAVLFRLVPGNTTTHEITDHQEFTSSGS